MALLVSEIFDSVQGEGPWNGVPSTFLRLAGCPLRCLWCDTPYASHAPVGELLSFDQLFKRLTAHTLEHVVITGGEPFAFEELPLLVDQLKRAGRLVTIETSGVIWRQTAADLTVLSPKLSHSDPTPADGFSEAECARHLKLRSDTGSLQQFAAQFASHPAALALKFVVERRSDLEEIRPIVALFPQLPREQVILMPQARSADRLAALSREMVDWCMTEGWRLGTRIQVQLWGDRRGV